MEALERAKTNGQGPRRPQANAKSTPRKSFDSSTPWSPPIFGGRGPQRSAPENHLRDNETSFWATVHGRGDRERSRDRPSRPRPPSPVEMAVLCWSLFENNTLELRSNILELALGNGGSLLEFI